MDEIKPTPRNKLLGLLADGLRGGLDFATSDGKNKPMNLLAELLGVPAVANVADKLSYGENLTSGKGFATRLKPEVFDAAISVAPLASPMMKGAGLLAEGINTGAAMIGKAAAPSTERLVNSLMAKGGLPAQLLQDMAQGTKSHIFIGQNAKNFDKNNLAKAIKMEKEGVAPRQIWSETGSMKAPWDKQWRQEIDDSVANIPYSPDRSGRADMFVKHPELFDNYPSMSGMSFGVDSQSMKPLNGSYLASSDAITLGAGNKSTGLHELQHAIQGREGFASGGSIGEFGKQSDAVNARDALSWAKELKNKYKDMKGADVSALDNAVAKEYESLGAADFIPSRDARELARQPYVLHPEHYPDSGINDLNSLIKDYGLDKRVTPYTDMEAYRRLAGEAEARAVQARMNMDAGQRRATYPLDSFDVPVDQLITRFGDPPAMSQGNERLLKILERNGESIAPKFPQSKTLDTSYRGSHTAPSSDFGAPLYDLTGGGTMYPADVYSAKATQYYGTGYPKADREAFSLANKVRGNPDAEVTIYRAVPNSNDINAINQGDWVTLSRDYAKTHGESALKNEFKILEQKAKAKELFTNADSIHEFGYQPSLENNRLIDILRSK